MLEQLPNILTWALLWGLSWGFFLLYIYKRIDYIKHFIWTALYFLATAIITSFIFSDYIVRIFENFTPIPFLVLVGVLVIHVFLYFYIPKHLKEPEDYFQRYPKRQYLTLDKRRLVSKSMDILAQQLFVVLLVLFLQDAGLSFKQIILSFALVFGIVHLPLIFLERGWPSWYFTIGSILSAILFPILIIKVHYGFVYSYIVHWIFYTFTAVGFWIWYNRHKENNFF